jgi:hypothetical protein
VAVGNAVVVNVNVEVSVLGEITEKLEDEETFVGGARVLNVGKELGARTLLESASDALGKSVELDDIIELEVRFNVGGDVKAGDP